MLKGYTHDTDSSLFWEQGSTGKSVYQELQVMRMTWAEWAHPVQYNSITSSGNSFVKAISNWVLEKISDMFQGLWGWVGMAYW